MSSWEDIVNRHRPIATSYYNPLNREWVEPSRERVESNRAA